MGLHYSFVMRLFKKCPTIICLGATHTGKTLCASKALDLIAVDGAKLLEYQRTSEAKLRKLFSQNLPMLIHDPDSPETLKILAEETYENKAISDVRQRIIPGSLAIVTCNFDYLSQFSDII